MGYKLSIEISVHPTDANRILGRHWSVKSRLNNYIKKEIQKSVLGKKPIKPLTKFNIRYVRVTDTRYLDYDNLITSLKPATDGLRLAKIIENDGWKYINGNNFSATQEKGSEKKILIEVEET